MMVRLFLTLSLLASALTTAGAGEVTRDPIRTILYKSTEPPYCVGTADPACFRLEVEPPTIKLGSRDGDLSLRYTLRYTGSRVVWQSYTCLADRWTGEIDPGEGVTDGPLQREVTRFDELRTRNACDPFSNGFRPTHSGIVFCGDAVETTTVEQHYLHLADPSNIQAGNALPEEAASFIDGLARERTEHNRQLRYVTTEMSGSLLLSDFVRFTKPGGYTLRLGYCLYPDTKWGNLAAPLNNRVVVWSEPIAVEVEE